MEFVQVDKGLLEGLLDNIFCVLPDAGIASSKRKHSLLVTLNQDFKGPLISVFSRRDEQLVRHWVTGVKDGWFRSVVHHEPLDQLHAGERRVEVFTNAVALTHEVKAIAAPNLENRKWLNFQDKIDRKSKVSKLNDVENVEIVEAVEGAEATRNDYEEAIHSGMPRSPRSLDGIIESKKSAEWWNVINDENHEWTDSPKHQKSQTQQDYDLVHITSMRKTRTRLFFFILTVIG